MSLQISLVLPPTPFFQESQSSTILLLTYNKSKRGYSQIMVYALVLRILYLLLFYKILLRMVNGIFEWLLWDE